MITGKDIIFISSIEWNFLWQIHQEISTRLARAGNRVLYIENTGIRSPGLHDIGRVAHRLRRWTTSLLSKGVREVAPNIYVVSPLVLPPFGSSWQRSINRHLLLPQVKGIARKLGMRDPLLWTYLPTDTTLDLLQMLSTPRSVLIYYCVADFSQLTAQVRQLRQCETAILKLTDLAFTNCSQLAEHCRAWNDNVHVFPPGVDLEAFLPHVNGDNNNHRGSALDASTKTASDNFLQSLPRPIIGYVGGLHRWVDYSLLIEMARARPHWSWVFVGAITTQVGELAELPNVHLLGQQPHSRLAHFINSFDVCTIPYLNNPATATVVPVKLNEYLAVNKPVVSTELPTVCDFNQQHKVLLTVANQPERFLQAIEQALNLPNDARTAARRREVAALSEWQPRLDAMSNLIEMKILEKSPAEM